MKQKTDVLFTITPKERGRVDSPAAEIGAATFAAQLAAHRLQSLQLQGESLARDLCAAHSVRFPAGAKGLQFDDGGRATAV